MSYYNFESYWKEFLRFNDIISKDLENEEKYKSIAKLAYKEAQSKNEMKYNSNTTSYNHYHHHYD